MRQNPFLKKLANMFFAMIFLACTTVVYAQSFDQPVSWSSKVEKVGDNVYEMQFHGAIEGKWHIYDLGPYDGGPNPTVLKIEEVAGVKLVGTPYIKSDIHKAFDEMFNMEVGS